MKTGVHIIVKGRVQGVGFRWFVETEANRLGLTGFVKNLYSGDVEIEAEGKRGLIEILIKQLKIGNRLSHVVDLIINYHEIKNKYTNFNIRF